jgi:hypothetical protein
LRADAIRRFSVACAAFAALAIPARPAPAALLNLTCPMAVSKPDALHQRDYPYYVSVDQDAGRASDDFGAYYLWPAFDGSGYMWFVQTQGPGNANWSTQYSFNLSNYVLTVEERSSDGRQIGAARGICTPG